MTNGTRQMTAHVEAAYKDAVENINFLKRQQWVATNYAVLVYAAIFVISGTYFSRTDFARNMLGIVTLVTFVIHWYMIYVFQRAIQRYRRRLDWVYQTYFSQVVPSRRIDHSVRKQRLHRERRATLSRCG